MSRYGVLARLLPAFGRVAGRMQYDLFHVYTVDQHTLFVIRNIRRFADPASATELPLAHELYARLRKPELLLLAGIFHDIAKGRGGDHSELGERDARDFCARIGLSATDADLVAWLVRQHLLMSITAQKQDISDPVVVHRFAERGRRCRTPRLPLPPDRGRHPRHQSAAVEFVEGPAPGRAASRRALRAAARPRAPGARARARARDPGHGAGPAARCAASIRRRRRRCGRASRTTCSCARRRSRSRGRPAPSSTPAPAARRWSHCATRGHGTTEAFVYSPDRDGLFATITAALDRAQLDVLDARIVTSTRGYSLDTFQVLDADGRPLDDPARARQLLARLRDELSRPTLALAAGAARARTPRTPVPGPGAGRVLALGRAHPAGAAVRRSPRPAGARRPRTAQLRRARARRPHRHLRRARRGLLPAQRRARPAAGPRVPGSPARSPSCDEIEDLPRDSASAAAAASA